MIEAVHTDLSITAQCCLLSISRSSFYYAPQPEPDETLALALALALMRVIDAAFPDMPQKPDRPWQPADGSLVLGA